MSTYLLAWAVGEFDYVQAVTKGNKMYAAEIAIEYIILHETFFFCCFSLFNFFTLFLSFFY